MRTVLIATFFLFSLLSSFAQAQDTGTLNTALARFQADSFSETEAAISEITSSGAPTAPAILEAAAARRLFYSPSTKAVFYKDASEKPFDAATGQPLATPPDDAKAVRFNNKLRGMLDTALGALMLQSPDASKRLESAASIFKSRDPKKLAAIDTALASEHDQSVKQALKEAKAAIVLTSSADNRVLALQAISDLRVRGDQDALALLQSLPANAPDDVRKAAASSAQSVQFTVSIWNFVQNLWYGLSLSSVLLLAAIGLAITFGVMGVINMAHGEMVMLGAYTTFVVQEAIRSWAPGLFDYSLLFAVPLAILVSGAVGV